MTGDADRTQRETPNPRWTKTLASLSLACHVIEVRHEPVGSARHVHQGRASALLQLTWRSDPPLRSDHAVLESWGEACPLTGFGPLESPSWRDSLAQALKQLDAVPPQDLLGALRAPEPWRALSAVTARLTSPSARHAVESAMGGLIAQLSRRPLWQLLSEHAGGTRPCAQVLTSAALDPLATGFVQQVAGAAASGISTVKLKVGKHLDGELDALSRLATQTPLTVQAPSTERGAALRQPQLKLRLDANRSLDHAGALHLARGALRAARASAGAIAIEWLEDPTPDPADWPELSQLVPIALDEALQDPRLGPSQLLGNLATFRPAALVLKPMALGLNQALEWASRAVKARIDVVVSHYFDGVVALVTGAHLAFAVQSSARAAGLGLHSSIGAWQSARAAAALPPTLPALPTWMYAGHWAAPTSLETATTDGSAELRARGASTSHGVGKRAPATAKAAEEANGPSAAREAHADENGAPSLAARSFSVSEAAVIAPHKDALILVARDGPAQSLTYAELAQLVGERCAGQEDAAARSARQRRARPILAESRLEPILEIYACLESGHPALLQHPRWPKAQLEASAQLAASTALQPDDAFVLATSGSSASPKYVVLERHAVLAGALASEANLDWAPSGDRWLLNLPLAHIGGLSVLLRCLAARQTVVVSPPGVTPADLQQLLHDQSITLLSLVPTQLARLLRDPTFDISPSVRAILVGGAPASAELRQAAKARGWPILSTYGMTETASQIATERPTGGAAHIPAERLPRGGTTDGGASSGHAALNALTSCGPPLPGIEVTCKGSEIHVRGPTLMRGYVGRPTPLDANGWFPTGDRGHIEANGDLVIDGRVDNVIITGGENVSPEQVEAALAALDHVAQCCVVGIPDVDWGERLVALVTLASADGHPTSVRGTSTSTDADPPGGPTPAAAKLLAASITHAWREQLRATLPAYAIPKEYRSVPELPVLASGKLDRRAALTLASVSRS